MLTPDREPEKQTEGSERDRESKNPWEDLPTDGEELQEGDISNMEESKNKI